MKCVLKKKQNIRNEDWLYAIKHIEELVSKEEIKQMETLTVNEIRKTTEGKKAAYAWSGGKDSIVLADLCRKAEITNCMIGICDLEYPVFLKWIENNKPEGLEIVNTGQGLEWLAKHSNLLFPQKSSIAAKWYSMVQHTAQKKYYKEKQLDMILLGRRTADGNYTGKNGFYTNREGITRYSPIYQWKHEAVLAYIHYNNLSLPPIYDWEDGYKQGTHPWSARLCEKEQEGWETIYKIDRSIVENASKYIKSAKDYLEGLAV